MPYGSLYYGENGFLYKKWGGGGGRRNPPLGLLNCASKRIFNDYVPGAGVGATSIAARRSKTIRATKCSSNYQCNTLFPKLGLYSKGGSNNYALNWTDINYSLLYSPNPNPNPNPRATYYCTISTTKC